MEMKFYRCKHCGQIIDGNSKFCNHCGEPQDSLGQRKLFSINKTGIADAIITICKELIIWLLVAFTVCVIGLVVINVFYGGNEGTDGSAVIISSIMVIMAGRYIYKIVKWVIKNKSKK